MKKNVINASFTGMIFMVLLFLPCIFSPAQPVFDSNTITCFMITPVSRKLLHKDRASLKKILRPNSILEAQMAYKKTASMLCTEITPSCYGTTRYYSSDDNQFIIQMVKSCEIKTTGEHFVGNTHFRSRHTFTKKGLLRELHAYCIKSRCSN